MEILIPSNRVVIIAGPTASGKSDFAVELAKKVGGEIINADAAQMYSRVSIGTAKPADWQTHEVPHHLFDVCDQPISFDVARYRTAILALVAGIRARGKIPILVGGSVFYLKSLFFPPHMVTGKTESIPASVRVLSALEQWKALEAIDPERSALVHPHDTYRVTRALALFYESGQKPSSFLPQFTLPFAATIIVLSPPLAILHERINRRTVVMLEQQGWIDEVAGLMHDADWRAFICTKGFIGYQSIASWLEAGRPQGAYTDLIACIQQETRQYAKRQLTFLRGFVKHMRSLGDESISVVESLGE